MKVIPIGDYSPERTDWAVASGFFSDERMRTPDVFVDNTETRWERHSGVAGGGNGNNKAAGESLKANASTILLTWTPSSFDAMPEVGPTQAGCADGLRAQDDLV